MSEWQLTSGIITDLQRFSLYDGSGIRTTVFLKGCPLRCAWCHNPECLSPKVQLRFVERRCVQCGRCAAVCPNQVHTWGNGAHQVHFERCAQCGRCESACPTEALKLTGRHVTAQQVMQTVIRDRAYYETSGGGVTISGGEPMMQPEFLSALLHLAKEADISTAVETSGCISSERFAQFLPLVDLFLLDCKETDEERHKRFTGQGRHMMLANLALLMQQKRQVILRCPLIPGCNLRKEHLDGIVQLTQAYPMLAGCELMAYHTLGTSKYRELGMKYTLTASEMAEETKAEILQYMQQRAAVPVKWG